MAEVHDMRELRKGGSYEVETLHTFRGRFVGIEKIGQTEHAVFETGGRGKDGPLQRKVPRYSFRRAAD